MIFGTGENRPGRGAAPPGPETMRRPPPDEVPAEYNSKSDLFATVSADGPNRFDFSIVTKKARPADAPSRHPAAR